MRVVSLPLEKKTFWQEIERFGGAQKSGRFCERKKRDRLDVMRSHEPQDGLGKREREARDERTSGVCCGIHMISALLEETTFKRGFAWAFAV